MKKRILLAVVSMLLCFGGILQAQSPYQHSVGVTLGNMQAFSYKTFVTDHFAIQVDLGTKILCTDGENFKGLDSWDLELNPNFMYEGNFVSGLYGFAGGGVSLGYSWTVWDPGYYFSHLWDAGKFGINAMLGLEYKLNIPLTLQFDFRPGYGLWFGEDYYYYGHRHSNTVSYFDWSVNAGIRYAF
ncbi:MAG: hypothetical protein J5644_08985 [Bacteroidales bacterium]|nr:hypothetical protein [Bacteroidales bacterium]